jgi:hypothetical protein
MVRARLSIAPVAYASLQKVIIDSAVLIVEPLVRRCNSRVGGCRWPPAGGRSSGTGEVGSPGPASAAPVYIHAGRPAGRNGGGVRRLSPSRGSPVDIDTCRPTRWPRRRIGREAAWRRAPTPGSRNAASGAPCTHSARRCGTAGSPAGPSAARTSAATAPSAPTSTSALGEGRSRDRGEKKSGNGNDDAAHGESPFPVNSRNVSAFVRVRADMSSCLPVQAALPRAAGAFHSSPQTWTAWPGETSR